MEDDPLLVYYRMQPQDLESAVGVIQSQRRKEMDTGSQQEGSVDAASLAKFLLLQVDAEQVRYHTGDNCWNVVTAFSGDLGIIFICVGTEQMFTVAQCLKPVRYCII